MELFAPEFLLKVAILAYAVGVAGSVLCLGRDRAANGIAFGSAIVGGLCGVGAALLALVSGGAGPAAAFEPVGVGDSGGGTDRKARRPWGVFPAAGVVAGGGAVDLLAGLCARFLRPPEGRHAGAAYNSAVLAITLVFCAANAFFFLIAWEIMALSSYCLVILEHQKAETRNAGLLFFIMSHIGTGCLILGFLLMSQAAGGFGFDGFRETGRGHAGGAAGRGVPAVPVRVWGESGDRAPACLAAGGPSRRPEQCLGAIVGGGHQDGHLRPGAGFVWFSGQRRRTGGG